MCGHVETKCRKKLKIRREWSKVSIDTEEEAQVELTIQKEDGFQRVVRVCHLGRPPTTKHKTQ